MNLDDRVLLVDKTAGLTSFAVVRKLRRVARVQKAGHCGSLDPLATGLLILCTGAATRVTSLFMELPKEYQARVRFGRSTDSYDADGRVTAEAPVPPLEAETVRAALRHFEGEIEQKPPMHSAVKVQGKRLYELARAGQEVERQARLVMVYEIALTDRGAEHADIRVRCGKGCYVRSIAHELGERLGVPSHLEALRRVAIGPFRIDAAVRLEELQESLVAGGGTPPSPRVAGAVLALPAALDFLPALRLRRAFESALLNGAQPELHMLREPPRTAGAHRLLSDDGKRLLAVGMAGAETASVRLLRVFHTPLSLGEGETDPV